jgi:GT2 family glycosyltransferase
VAPELTVCIVNYDGEEHLPATLDAVAALGDVVSETILVDNASTDGSVALVEERAPGVRVVRLAENRGPGHARNAGLDAARHDRILLLDNDVRPAPDVPALLQRALDERPGVSVVVPRILYAHDPATIQFDGAGAHFLGMMTLLHAESPGADTPDDPVALDSLVTAAFLVDRARLGDLRFDERLFMYLEDHHFGLRLRLRGHGLLAVPAARCLHGSGTPGMALRTTGSYHPLRVRGTITNRWHVLLELYELRTLLLLAPALACFELFQLAGCVAKGWLGHWVVAAAGMARQVPDILRARGREQAARRVPDGAFLAGGPVPFSAGLVDGGAERVARRVLQLVADSWWELAGGLLAGSPRR